jgi:hypothetical protein
MTFFHRIYGCFTEGFGTPDLRNAEDLLDDLAQFAKPQTKK